MPLEVPNLSNAEVLTLLERLGACEDSREAIQMYGWDAQDTWEKARPAWRNWFLDIWVFAAIPGFPGSVHLDVPIRKLKAWRRAEIERYKTLRDCVILNRKRPERRKKTNTDLYAQYDRILEHVMRRYNDRIRDLLVFVEKSK